MKDDIAIKRRQKTRVLIVDDSASVRLVLKDIIEAEPDLEVMGAASDAQSAARRMKSELPDVIVLDIEMPKIDGITFLKRIMNQKPIPVVVCSGFTPEGSDKALEAYQAGAVEVIQKPNMSDAQSVSETRQAICHAIRAASHSKLRRRDPVPDHSPVESRISVDTIIPKMSDSRIAKQILRLPKTEPIICIGASTGGTEALQKVFDDMPADAPPILVVQHMPPHFTAAFARRLASRSAIDVREAEGGEKLERGIAFIAPGGRHMCVERRGRTYYTKILDGPHISRHRPSVDMLFRSAAQEAGANAVGVIMTGMGDDGAETLLEMRKMGSHTIAQDEASCIVFGMPKVAINKGGVVEAVDVMQIAKSALKASKDQVHK